MSKIQRFRDSITGLFTTKKHAQANPSTTQGIAQKPLGSTLDRQQQAEVIRGARVAATDIIERMRTFADKHDIRVNERFADNYLLGEGLRVTVTVTIESSRE